MYQLIDQILYLRIVVIPSVARNLLFDVVPVKISEARNQYIASYLVTTQTPSFISAVTENSSL